MGLSPKPDLETGFVPDPRLDPFRDRAARATLPDGRSGVLYVESVRLATLESGHLWWRCWSAPYENAILWLDLPDGVCTDIWLSDGAAIEAETEQWARREWTGVRQGGRPAPIYALEWLGDEESRRIRAAFIDPGTDESQA